MKKPLAIALIVLLVLVGAYAIYAYTTKDSGGENANSVANTTNDSEVFGEEEPIDNVNATTNMDETNATDGTAAEFSQEVKVPHYEGTVPAHEDVLPAVPVNVVIMTNFDLAAPSSISVTSNGTEYATGETSIESTKLAMRRTLKMDAPDGRYIVTYKACWPDASCHDGRFEYEIDSSLTADFVDRRNEKNVAVTLADLAFDVERLRVSKGTMVTWQNNDEVGHYINTEPHPGHAYYPTMNSKELLTGDTFNVTFTTPGYYPYHCSTHPDEMRGIIIVE